MRYGIPEPEYDRAEAESAARSTEPPPILGLTGEPEPAPPPVRRQQPERTTSRRRPGGTIFFAAGGE